MVGHRWSQRSHEIKTFLTRNHVPYQWLEIDRDDAARRLAGLAQAGLDDLPLVLVPDGEPLRAPSNLDLASALGLRTRAEQPLYDLCIVGGGPAGLAAAVYAASRAARRRRGEGGARRTGRAERVDPELPRLPEGSVGRRPRPARGRSGYALRGADAARTGRRRAGDERSGARRQLRRLRDLEARAVVIASGVSYRRLEGPGLEDLAGRGVYYGSSASEASQCEGDDVYVVGGANSATQAALNFARYAKRVVMVVRGARLEDTMSMYLVAQVQANDKIEVRLRSSVVAAKGDDHLAAISICQDGSPPEEVPTNWLFVYIGASPRTDWLGPTVARGPRGFVLTGPDLLASSSTTPWPLARAPYALETNVPGVFAAGDVRLDSMKRVASAVGEGAMAIYLVHRYLAST